MPSRSRFDLTTLTTHDLSPEDSAQDAPHLATIAKRFSARARTSPDNADLEGLLTEVLRKCSGIMPDPR